MSIRQTLRLIIQAMVVLTLSYDAVAQAEDLTVSADRLEQHLVSLSRFGANPEGGVSRVAYSEADIAGRAYVTRLMQVAGLTVHVDTAGNIIGRREGSVPELPAIMLGSHTDSVPHGGNFDGDVGVLGAIEVAQTLRERGVVLRHPLEVVNFTDEEGARSSRLESLRRYWGRSEDFESFTARVRRLTESVNCDSSPEMFVSCSVIFLS